ncbi:MAG: hypothetical protein GX154_12550 [Clostridiales bacterium]|nr:hypothetical protein [Clostridiales bacterium]
MLKKSGLFVLILIVFISNVYCDSYSYNFEIMKDSDLSTTVYVNDSGDVGNSLIIIGGIHGNETAGIMVAEELSSYTPQKGVVIVIPRANTAACKSISRTEYYLDDLNRSFIGDVNGNNTQRLAWEIAQTIIRYKPVMVIDLHESKGKYDESTGFIGESIVIDRTLDTDSVLIAFEVMDKLNFTILSGAPEGSINKEISENLGIPVITIETDANQELEQRVTEHLQIINIMLKYYGLED